MTDYTPTTHVVRERYWIATVNDTDFPGVEKYANDTRAEFDRWLEAHDREVAAKAWDEGFDKCAEYVNGPDWAPAPPNPYRAYRIRAEREDEREVQA